MALLVAQGIDVRCLVRPKSQTSRIDFLNVERALGDILDKPSLMAAMEGCEACIHLASVVSWEAMGSDLLETTIVDGTRHVLDAAITSGVRRLVYVSSSSAINGSTTPRLFDEQSVFELSASSLRYAKAKHRAEEICRTVLSRLDVIIVNPVETYGPNDFALITARNLVDILKGWPAIGCRGGTAVAHVDDVAKGISCALSRGRSGDRYILGGENLTIEQLIRLTLQIAGQKKPVLILPNGLIRLVTNTLARLNLPTPLLPDVVEYATRFWFMDTSKAKRDLGYEFRPAKEVLKPTIRWLYDSGLVT